MPRQMPRIIPVLSMTKVERSMTLTNRSQVVHLFNHPILFRRLFVFVGEQGEPELIDLDELLMGVDAIPATAQHLHLAGFEFSVPFIETNHQARVFGATVLGIKKPGSPIFLSLKIL